jgi:hypothetical protein
MDDETTTLLVLAAAAAAVVWWLNHRGVATAPGQTTGPAFEAAQGRRHF